MSKSSYIVIENNYTYNTHSSGIGVWQSDNISVDGNEVELACNDGSQEEITISQTHGFVVKNNYVHDGGPGTNGGEGIDAKDSYDGQIFGNHVVNVPRLGIYVDAYNLHSYNIQVFQNLVHDVRGNGIWLGAEQSGLLENIQVYNNVIYGNKNFGIGLTDCCQGSPTHPMKDITIINNTVYNNGWVAGGGIIVRTPDVQNIVIRNNITSQNLQWQIRAEEVVPLAELHIDHNLIYGQTTWKEEQDGTDIVEADPIFVNAAIGDFHLQGTSPATNVGSVIGAPSTDFDGYPRDLLPDIGAFEFLILVVNPPTSEIFSGGIATYTLDVRGISDSTITNLVASSSSPYLTLQVVPAQVLGSGQAVLTITDSSPQYIPGQRFSIPITATNNVTQIVNAQLLTGALRLYLPMAMNGK